MLREKIKNWKMELAAVLVFVLVLGMTGLSGSVKAADQTDLKTIDIMFVHDTHSHLNSFSTVVPQQATGTLTTTIQQRHLANLTLMAQIPPKPLAIRLVETTILPLPATAVPRI